MTIFIGKKQWSLLNKALGMVIKKILLISVCVYIAITIFFIYLCKKLSINYKTFLLHSFLGFLGSLVILTLETKPSPSIFLALCFCIAGFLIRQEIISFIYLFIGLVRSYDAFNMSYVLLKLSETIDINNKDSFIITIITFPFFITMSTFLLWAIWHKKYKLQK